MSSIFVTTLFVCSLVSMPIWLPLVFAAFAFGRRQYSVRLLLLLLTIEAASLIFSLRLAKVVAVGPQE